jgi:hypothetical protein
MQTKTMCFFVGQNTGLQAKFWKRERGKSVRGLSLVFSCRLLKIVCDMIWDMRLLKTSILVTKRPLRALRFLSCEYVGRKHISRALINDVKDSMVRVVKEIVDDLFRGLKQFVYAFFRGLE